MNQESCSRILNRRLRGNLRIYRSKMKRRRSKIWLGRRLIRLWWGLWMTIISSRVGVMMLIKTIIVISYFVSSWGISGICTNIISIKKHITLTSTKGWTKRARLSRLCTHHKLLMIFYVKWIIFIRLIFRTRVVLYRIKVDSADKVNRFRIIYIWILKVNIIHIFHRISRKLFRKRTIWMNHRIWTKKVLYGYLTKWMTMLQNRNSEMTLWII